MPVPADTNVLATLFAGHGLLWLSTALILGLIVGSFLNVVIHRLPLMLEQSWQRDCRALLELPAPDDESSQKPITLAHPPSRCPHCQKPIRAWQNVPVLSWLLLKGRCHHCKTSISVQYPLVELTAGLLALLAAWMYGPNWQAVWIWGLSWTLLAAAIIDLKTTLLPDLLTLPLLWAGLLIALIGKGAVVALDQAVIGAMAGYLSLWSVYWLFKLITGKEGMGYGDFKLLAALGAWMGWKVLPLVILLSAGVGAIVGIAMILFLRHDRRIPIPFGPYLATAGLLAYYLGQPIMNAYLGGHAGF